MKRGNIHSRRPSFPRVEVGAGRSAGGGYIDVQNLSEEFVRGPLTCRELAEEARRKVGHRGYGDKKRGEEVTETTHVYLFVLVSSRAATFCVMDKNAASLDFLPIFGYQGSIEDQSYGSVQTKTYLTEFTFPSERLIRPEVP